MSRIVFGLWASLGLALPAQAQDGAAAGRALYEQHCAACHSVDANRVGPAHRGVFGRRAGLAPGFRYSAALKRSSVVWDAKTLDAWLANPERVIPGQKMYAEFDDPAVRAAIIEFLRSQK
jgi:cytochrome c